jgi:fatty-acyl-CoA synthase
VERKCEIVNVLHQARDWSVIVRANTVPFERPDRLAKAMVASRSYGSSALGAVAAASARYPESPALIVGDERLTYRELWRSATALACALQDDGIGDTSRVGVLCRNGPLFLQAMLAVSMIGADLILLNTGMAGPQLADVIGAEELDLVVHDAEFAEHVALVDVRHLDSESARDRIDSGSAGDLPPPPRNSRFVVLTSGTTGRPKGAIRSADGNVSGVAALLARIPLRARDTVVVPSPFFHARGLGPLLLSLSLSCPIVPREEVDAEKSLIDVTAHRANVLVVVPAMLQRICDLEPTVLSHHDARSLRIIASGGSALPTRVVEETLRHFGPVLYNTYGSTEVSTASVAVPADLRVAPSTAGRPAPGVRVEVVDVHGQPVPVGEIGRVVVGNKDRFVSYTNGSVKEDVRGLVVTGDLGHFDGKGRLFIDGREDDMIVSGGENVYPREVEELLGTHPDIAEAVVVGVADDRFGQALKAFVVTKPAREPDPESLRDFVRERLAKYKVPRTIELIDELPRTATGKVLRRELR